MLKLKDILAFSKADDCIVLYSESLTENIRWANSTTTTNGTSQENMLVVISIIKGTVGSASASYSEALNLKELVEKSELIAKQNAPAEDKMPLPTLADITSIPKTTTLSSTNIAALTKPLAATFKKAEEAKLDLFGYAELKTSTLQLVTSTGIARQNTHRVGQIELNAKTRDRATSIWAGQSIGKWEDQTLDSLYTSLVKKVGWSKNKIDIEPGHYTTLLEPSAVADLLIYGYWESAARDADEGRTVFHQFTKDKPKVFNKAIKIYSDPHEPGYECLDFLATAASNSYESIFDSGATVEKRDWIADGTVQSLFSPRYYAKKHDRQEKYFIENLIFESDNTEDTETMIKNVKKGLLVTCLWYIREVDPRTLLLTGLTRDGVFVIEDGKIIGAANNFRFNMSPIDMLKNTEVIGGSVRTLAREFGDYFKLTKMPPLLIKDFNMSSRSDAS